MSADTLLLANPITFVPELLYKGYQAASEPGKKAARAAKDLEEQRRTELGQEADARAAAQAKAAVRGQNFGSRADFVGGLGFGSGNSTPGLGRGNLFGN
jgi:hypothetical protein